MKQISGERLQDHWSSGHKVFTACHTDENRIKQGSNLNIADKRVAKPSRAELLGMK